MWRQCGCYLGDNVYVTLETMWSLLFYHYLLFLMCSCIFKGKASPLWPHLSYVATPPHVATPPLCGHTSPMWPHLPYVATPPPMWPHLPYVATPPHVATPPLCGHTSPMWPHLPYVATPPPMWPHLPYVATPLLCCHTFPMWPHLPHTSMYSPVFHPCTLDDCVCVYHVPRSKRIIP